MKNLTLACLTMGMIGLLVGCGDTATPEKKEETKTSSTSAAVKTTPVVNVSEQSMAKLAAADMADGTQDKVITKCYSCALGMDGDKENSATVGEYTANFCSEACCKHFVEDADTLIAETEIPAAK